MRLGSLEEASEEVGRFHGAGGGSIDDVTPKFLTVAENETLLPDRVDLCHMDGTLYENLDDQRELFDRDTVDRIVTDNPRRVLTFNAPA
jgi:predicted metal-dependent phosphotriesterase family hydrolase